LILHGIGGWGEIQRGAQAVTGAVTGVEKRLKTGRDRGQRGAVLRSNHRARSGSVISPAANPRMVRYASS